VTIGVVVSTGSKRASDDGHEGADMEGGDSRPAAKRQRQEDVRTDVRVLMPSRVSSHQSFKLLCSVI